MHRRSEILALLVWVILAMSTQAQSVLYRDTTPQLTVPFLYERPAIDGKVDFDVNDLPVHHMGVIERTDSTQPYQEVSYRLGYGADFLYLYLEVPVAKITYRDRGYQNGDGLVVVISSVEPGNKPTNEFYVLGFTPQSDTSQAWQKAFVWYHDVDLVMKPLKEARFACAELGDKVGYEVLIPWSALHPYHPWLGTQIGFNLCYTAAVGKSDKTYQFVVGDDQIQSEQHPRLYTPLTFLYPTGGTTRAAVRLERNNIHQGQSINAYAAFLADSNVTQDMRFFTYSKVRGQCCERLLTMVGTGKVDTSSIYMPTLGLEVGDYSIKWKCGVDSGALDLTVLPNFHAAQVSTDLASLGSGISLGSETSMRFLYDQIRSETPKLKSYQSAENLRAEMTQLQALLKKAVDDTDVLALQTGVLRRAFRSRVDSSLQPYSLNVPAKLDRKKRYPLVVFLHGSGQDDREVLPLSLVPDSMFVLAPYGRGTSNSYSADHAQEDILEAISDVAANYPIDTSRIVISGFSMGGYGAYRALFEQPAKYRGVAVFSGHPNLANQWSGGSSEPNFLEQKFLVPFKGRDVFIFHGGRDRNCPIELTQQLVGTLKSAGAKVSFVFEPEAGHEYPTKASIQKFRAWLSAVIK